MIGSESMKSLAVVRGDDISKVKTALRDLVRYAHLSFIGNARMLEPEFADNVLVSVMKSPLKSCCEAASIVPLDDDASIAIGRIKRIHPPAHIIIVSPRHEIFYELAESVEVLPEIELDFTEDESEYSATDTNEYGRESTFGGCSTADDIKRRIAEEIKRKTEDDGEDE